MGVGLRLPKSVRSVVVLRPDASGRMVSAILHAPERKTKKGTRWLRPVEKMVRRATKGEQAFADAYLARHQGSNEKKRDGWLRDLGYNIYKADTKRRKKWRILDSFFLFM